MSILTAVLRDKSGERMRELLETLDRSGLAKLGIVSSDRIDERFVLDRLDDVDGRAAVTFVLDRFLPLRTVLVDAVDPELARTILNEICSTLGCISAEELAAGLRRTADPDDVLRFAHAARDDESPTNRAVLRAMFAHDDPQVRVSAADAASVTGWDSLRDDVQALLNDADATVREHAAAYFDAEEAT